MRIRSVAPFVKNPIEPPLPDTISNKLSLTPSPYLLVVLSWNIFSLKFVPIVLLPNVLYWQYFPYIELVPPTPLPLHDVVVVVVVW